MSLAMPGPWKHPRTSTYYLKQRVPADLLPMAIKTIVVLPVDGVPCPVTIGDQVKVSLRTKDPKLAKERHREADDALSLHWKALRSAPVELSTRQRLALAGEVYHDLVARFDEEPGEADSWKALVRYCVAATVSEGNPQDGLDLDAREILDGMFRGTLDPRLSHRGLRLSQRARDMVLFEIAIAVASAAATILRKAEGDYSPSIAGNRYPVWKEPTAAPVDPNGRQTISGLFELWRADRAKMGGAESSAKRWAGPIASFVQFLGHDDATSVESADVIRWRMALLENGTPPSTFVRVHSAAVKAIFSFGVSNLLLPSNPVLGVRFKAPKETKTRSDGFTSEEAIAILKAANAAPAAPGGTGEVLRRAFRWVPWLCAYSGARVGEIAQLRKDDILEVEGVLCLRITPEAGSVKNKAYRDVPVHPHLLDLGFLDFVNRMPAGPLFYSRTSSSSRPWATTTGRLAAWVREVAGVTDERIGPNHAWRHLFKTIADEVGIDPKYADAICGHAGRTQGDKYGYRTPKTLLREIERFPRWDLSGGSLPSTTFG